MSVMMSVFLSQYIEKIESMDPGPEREDAIHDLLEFYGEFKPVQELARSLQQASPSEGIQNDPKAEAVHAYCAHSHYHSACPEVLQRSTSTHNDRCLQPV